MAAGAVGLAMGYLTLKLRGVFFSIATLALAIVAQAAVTNWEFVGGASGAYLLRPSEGPLAPATSSISSSSCWSGGGRGRRWRGASSARRSALACPPIRDDELAAEAYGVPTLRLKLSPPCCRAR